MSTPKRHVVIELRVQMVVDLHAQYQKTDDDVAFYFNESSHCLGTEIQQLARENDAFPGHCTVCSRTEVIVLREATFDDMKRLRPQEPENCSCFECRKRLGQSQ